MNVFTILMKNESILCRIRNTGAVELYSVENPFVRKSIRESEENVAR